MKKPFEWGDTVENLSVAPKHPNRFGLFMHTLRRGKSEHCTIYTKARKRVTVKKVNLRWPKR